MNQTRLLLIGVGLVFVFTLLFASSGEKEKLPNRGRPLYRPVETPTTNATPPAPSPVDPPANLAVESEITMMQAYGAIEKIGKKLVDILHGKPLEKKCKVETYGKGWGAHELCAVKPSLDCKFISFGISNDYSFDTDLAEKTGCNGIGLDPTVNHPSKIHDKVWFMQVAATTLDPPRKEWITTSVPSLTKWLGWNHVNVLKMDCEGCEYAIARDLIAEDKDFFTKVDQFALEIHVSKVWISTSEHLLNFGKLLYMLEAAGHEMISGFFASCHPNDEAPGCLQTLHDLKYPCVPTKMCQNLLFARLNKTRTL